MRRREPGVKLGLAWVRFDRLATRVASRLAGLGFETGRRDTQAGNRARVTRGAQQDERQTSES
jgi:hypothetical protein